MSTHALQASTEWYAVENADEIPSPALLIYPDRIAANLHRMVQIAGDASRLRPHVKTHKMPQIIQMKREVGITKFKTSTIAEAEMTAEAGGEDILLAYQPVGPNVRRLMELAERYPQSHFSALVDNPHSLQEIAEAARARGLTMDLYVDLNVGMNRTGIVPGPAALDLYRHLASTAGVRPAGLHAYDGHLHNRNADELAMQTRQAFAPVWEMRDQLRRDGVEVPRIIAAGTPTCAILANEDVELGAGTTVLWDSGQSLISPEMEFQSAAVLLTRVISRPAEHLVCLDLGHKALASEMPAPRVRVLGLEDAQQVIHSEEHLVLETPRADHFPVGTVLYGIPRHICPTVALYHEARCVRGGRAGETWPVVARARRLTI